MSEAQKNSVAAVVLGTVVIAAIALVAQTADLVQAIAAVLVISLAGVGITLIALVQARRSATKSLNQILNHYDEIGERALYDRFSDALLELPRAEQARLLEGIASRREVDPQRLQSALAALRSSEFSNSLDRIRFSVRELLGVQRRD